MALPLLVSFVEYGGYPNFSALYRQLGYHHEEVRAGRRAVGFFKQQLPAVVVAEFNLQREFRDRISALESILAVLHPQGKTRIIVLHASADEAALAPLHQRFPGLIPLPLPIDEAALRRVIPDLSPAGDRA
jgi:CheY-like chemotaxis protein